MMKVRISKSDFGNSVQVVFYYEEGNRHVIYNPSTQQFHELERGTLVPPEFVLKFSVFDWEQLKSSLLEELLSHGAKFPDEKFMEGELKATKFHLEDLRSLLKIKTRKA